MKAEVSNANLRILWVKAGKILPVDTGGKIRSYNLLQQLARRHDITFVSYYPGVRDPLSTPKQTYGCQGAKAEKCQEGTSKRRRVK